MWAVLVDWQLVFYYFLVMKKHELPTANLTILKRRSLLAIISNSIKGRDNYLFRNLYAKNNLGEEIDILNNGKNSCGTFVSWILLTLELITRPHAAVQSVEKDLLKSGWYEIKELKSGAVLVWEKKQANDKFLGKYGVELRHIGFYIGNNEAISNDSKGTGFPWKHHVTYNGTRKIEKIYWHPALSKD